MSKKIPNMPQRILLLITVGAQDLKVWKRSENAPEADRLSTIDLRAKHQEIRDNPNAWTVLTAADTRKPRSTGVRPLPQAQELARALGCTTPLFSGDGRLCLSVAKIEPILEGIIAHPDLEVAGALLFYTERLEENGVEMKSPSDGIFIMEDGENKKETCSFTELYEVLKNKGKKGLTVQRYKGLGEMNPLQLWETTMDPNTRRMKIVTLEDAVKAEEIFTILMGDAVEPRREFIERFAKEVKNLDI